MMSSQYPISANGQPRDYYQVAPGVLEGNSGRKKKNRLFVEIHALPNQVQQQITCKPVMEGFDNLFQTNLSTLPYVYNSAYTIARMPAQLASRYPNHVLQDSQLNMKRTGVGSSQGYDSKIYSNSELPYDPNAYNPIYFTSQQPSLQFTNFPQVKRDAVSSGQFQTNDNYSKKQQIHQPSQVVYLQQVNPIPCGTQYVQDPSTLYQQDARAYASFYQGKADTGKF